MSNRSVPGMPELPPGMSEPWQAQLFALTVHLNERGLFDWNTWASYFAPALARHQAPAFEASRRAAGQTLAPGGKGLPEAGRIVSARAGQGAGNIAGHGADSSADHAATLRDYFLAWQEALEQLLAEREIALPLDIGLRAQASGCYPRLARAPLVFRALAQAPGKAGPA